MYRFRRPRRLVLGGALLLTGLLAGPLSAHHAFAAYTVCYTDPVVQLSNGETVTLQATIYADPSQVTAVDYYLHAPHDTSVVAVSYDAYGNLENLHFYADRNQNKYAVDTVVTTSSYARVVSSATIAGMGPTRTASGAAGQDLWISFDQWGDD